MGKYHIKGTNKLSGELEISGSKNAVLPILASVVLNNGISVIHNCPKITDTYITIKILETLGCKVKMVDSTITVDSSTLNKFEVPENLVKEMRSSIIFLGGLLGRFGKVKISYPGGCENFWRRFMFIGQEGDTNIEHRFLIQEPFLYSKKQSFAHARSWYFIAYYTKYAFPAYE